MTTLQPRQVDSQAPNRWLREALALMARRPLAYSLSSLALAALFFAAIQVDNLPLRLVSVLLLPPLLTAGFLRLAQAADRSQPFLLSELLPSNAESLRVLAIAVTGYCVIFAPLLLVAAGGEVLAGQGVLDLHGRWEAGAADAAAASGLSLGLFTQALLLGASLTAFAGLLLGLGAWFMLPLASFGSLSLVQACLLSLQACRLNAVQLRFSSFFALLAVLGAVLASFGLLSVLLAPLFGAVLYVSFRDVFLGRAQNVPVAVKRQAAVNSAA